MSIFYTIEPVHPAAHLFGVTLVVDNPSADGERFSLPTWIPGSYMIRDFARNIVELSACSNGQCIELVQLDKTTWQAPPNLKSIELTYTVYAWDLSVRAAHLDQTHGFFNGTSVFLCVESQSEQPCHVTLLAPQDSSLSNWSVATSLPSADIDGQGFGRYLAQNYDELIDHPVEMGTFERVRFDACGIEHQLVLTGKFKTDTDRICRDLKKICEHQIRFFGEPPPVESYVFLVMVVGDGYGGLEHRASTSLLVKRDSLPVPGDKTYSNDYLEFLGLCSHEYFHTWNVKRIRPACFIPYELQQETYTSLLWAFEGFTSYYDDLSLYECGLIDRKTYLTMLGKSITRVYRTSGRHKQSVAQSSFNAWTKFYKQDENAANAIVSYYTKGSLVALSLDLIIREKFNGKKSLRDVMRRLWKDYLATGEGVKDGDIERIASEVYEQDLSAFFEQAVYGTDDLALENYLESVGVDLAWRAAEGQDDYGGVAGSSDKPVLSLGARLATVATGLRLTAVFDDGAAQNAGLSAGDILIAVNELSVQGGNLEQLLARYSVGDTLTVHAFRRDELIQTSLTLREPPLDTCVLSLLDDDSRIEMWLPGSGNK